ncbi:tetratricopeptide repeat protein [Aureivirga sp. CE67]|uniref:tetratricopeptide repeat protein n=1 Tax=Aureivirga sp. CE67 TaxID=1788983 RepID=UPI0018C9EB15|nr:tetratricopeptide repeat protein [Aureivirga sp. CE67]
MKKLVILIVICLSNISFGQEVKRFESSRGVSHLCGEFNVEVLEEDENFQKWFVKNYEEFPEVEKQKWAKKLKDVEVDIYLGTWCGDSKRWVPRFVKIWDDLGLKREQLKFIALYDSTKENTYKQSPDGEEKGKGIHRVPTFIFKRNQEEIARIVETPNNSLEVDIKQIAMDCPSKPNYRVANYFMKEFQEKNIDEIYENYSDYYRKAYYTDSYSELNTAGRVFAESGDLSKAIIIFRINSRIHSYEPRAYSNLAYALELDSKYEEAIENYEKVLLLDRSNESAKEGLKELRNK